MQGLRDKYQLEAPVNEEEEDSSDEEDGGFGSSKKKEEDDDPIARKFNLERLVHLHLILGLS